jgi:hypothetical protein
MPRELSQNELAEALRRQAPDAQEISRSLGRTLPVTLHLPKKSLTRGALQPVGKPRRKLNPTTKKPTAED